MMDVAVRTVFLLAGGALLALAFYCAISLLLAVHPPRFRSPLTPGDLGWRYENVTLLTPDGLELAAWYIPAVAGRASDAVVMLHGYPYDKGSIVSGAPFLHQDYDLLLFDFRYFGASRGGNTTLGVRERLDLGAALEYLQQQQSKSRVGLFGISLGASVALQGAPASPVIKAVVADSPYASLELIAHDTYRALWLLRYPLAWLTLSLARLYPGVDPRAGSPLQGAQAWDGPVLLIHGTADTQIGMHHASALAEALRSNPQAQIWFVDGADHGQAWGNYRQEYEARVLAFFGEHLRPPRSPEG